MASVSPAFQAVRTFYKHGKKINRNSFLLIFVNFSGFSPSMAPQQTDAARRGGRPRIRWRGRPQRCAVGHIFCRSCSCRLAAVKAGVVPVCVILRAQRLAATARSGCPFDLCRQAMEMPMPVVQMTMQTMRSHCRTSAALEGRSQPREIFNVRSPIATGGKWAFSGSAAQAVSWSCFLPAASIAQEMYSA